MASRSPSGREGREDIEGRVVEVVAIVKERGRKRGIVGGWRGVGAGLVNVDAAGRRRN